MNIEHARACQNKKKTSKQVGRVSIPSTVHPRDVECDEKYRYL